MNDFDADHILLDLTMSNILFNAVLLLDGAATFQKWKLCMMAYIISTGDSYILQKDHLTENFTDQDTCKVVEDWDIANAKVARNIILCVSDAIHVKISKLETAKEMWELFWTEYGTPGVMVAFSLFKSVFDLHISSDQHPGKVLDQLQMYFIELKDTKFELPIKTQIMLLLTIGASGCLRLYSPHFSLSSISSSCPLTLFKIPSMSYVHPSWSISICMYLIYFCSI